jgi:hypothetical protein
LARSRTGNNNIRKKTNKQVDWLKIFNYPVDIFLRGNDEKSDKMRRVRGRALSQRANKKKSFVGSARTHPLHTQQHGLQHRGRRFNY